MLPWASQVRPFRKRVCSNRLTTIWWSVRLLTQPATDPPERDNRGQTYESSSHEIKRLDHIALTLWERRFEGLERSSPLSTRDADFDASASKRPMVLLPLCSREAVQL